MPERDAFEGVYRRLAATRVSAPVRPLAVGVRAAQDARPVRWAASRLLPRLAALAPRRRGLRAGLGDD